MGKGRSLRKECAEPGCKEFGLYTDLTPEGYRRLAREAWRCVRHTQPEEVLSVTNVRREKIVESVQLPHGRYWQGSSGFMYGPGFKAYADDFPVGTKIRVIAEVIPAPETRAGHEKMESLNAKFAGRERHDGYGELMPKLSERADETSAPLEPYQKCAIGNCCMRAIKGGYCEGHTARREVWPLPGDSESEPEVHRE